VNSTPANRSRRCGTRVVSDQSIPRGAADRRGAGLGAAVSSPGGSPNASLTLGAAVHEIGWAWEHRQNRGRTVAARAPIELGAPATGGLWMRCGGNQPGRRRLPHSLVKRTGQVTLRSRPVNGGTVNRETVRRAISTRSGHGRVSDTGRRHRTSRRWLCRDPEDEVRLTNARGNRMRHVQGVGRHTVNGFASAGTLVIVGPGSPGTALRCGEIILQRLRRAGECAQQYRVVGAAMRCRPCCRGARPHGSACCAWRCANRARRRRALHQGVRPAGRPGRGVTATPPATRGAEVFASGGPHRTKGTLVPATAKQII